MRGLVGDGFPSGGLAARTTKKERSRRSESSASLWSERDGWYILRQVRLFDESQKSGVRIRCRPVGCPNDTDMSSCDL